MLAARTHTRAPVRRVLCTRSVCAMSAEVAAKPVVRACAPARCRLRTRSAVAAPAAPPSLSASCERAQTHVFIKRAGDAPAEGEAYVKLKIDSASCDDVADLVALACAAFSWAASSRVRLHLVLRAAAGGGGAPSAEDERRALAGDALFPAASLRSAGVEAGALLLARVPPGAGACRAGRAGELRPGSPARGIMPPLLCTRACTCSLPRPRQCAFSPARRPCSGRELTASASATCARAEPRPRRRARAVRVRGRRPDI